MESQPNEHSVDVSETQSPQEEDHSGPPTRPTSPAKSDTTLAPFDWADFESRYQEARKDANAAEAEILAEADKLMEFFKVWASAASDHDNGRAAKRLQTRQRFVRLSEQELEQKRAHLSNVMNAFQSALALLRQ